MKFSEEDVIEFLQTPQGLALLNAETLEVRTRIARLKDPVLRAQFEAEFWSAIREMPGVLTATKH